MKNKDFLKCQELSFEVWDKNRNLMSYLIQVYKRNGIKHEEYEHAKSLLSQLSKAMAKLNGTTDKKHDEEYADRETEPHFWTH